MKILVVDDSAAMRKIIRNALEGMGYSPASVLEATDGMDAIQMLREPRFKIDIVLADWNMPNMDGLKLLKELQAVEQHRNIPFIMVVGETQRDRVPEAIRAGACNYIVKPFTPETLREKVLAIETELIAQRRKKLTETAVIRLETPKVTRRRDSDLPFLAQLPRDLVDAVYGSASCSEHERGEVLIEPAEVVQSLHIIEGGEVEILPSSDGRAGDVCGRGECFGELSFLSGDPAALSARAKTDVVVASVEKSDFEDLLAKHPLLSFYLTRLLAKRARRAEAKLTSELEKGLSGTLDTITLAELIQTLHISRKTGLLRVHQDGVLRVTCPEPARPPLRGAGTRSRSEAAEAGGDAVPSVSMDGDEGEIYFVNGNVRQARIGGQKGEEAFYRLVTWAEGSFTFKTGSHRIEHGIFRATMGLLIEGMCRQDELGRMRA